MIKARRLSKWVKWARRVTHRSLGGRCGRLLVDIYLARWNEWSVDGRPYPTVYLGPLAITWLPRVHLGMRLINWFGRPQFEPVDRRG